MALNTRVKTITCGFIIEEMLLNDFYTRILDNNSQWPNSTRMYNLRNVDV